MNNDIEERRIVKQEPVYENGRITYYKIPNYTIRDEFITYNERIFLQHLIQVVKKINEELKEKNIFIRISTQVALNRIIEINNRRMPELYEEIKNKSIDFVLFNSNNGKIICCIELNGTEHYEDEERKKRDILLNEMLKERKCKNNKYR